MADSKTTQDAEARARDAAGVDPALSAQAIDSADSDGARGDPGSAQPQRQAEPVADRAQPPQPPPYISKRNEIISRFRTDRAAQVEETREDLSDFVRSGMPPEMEPQPQETDTGDADAAEPQPTPVEPAPEPAPQKPQSVKLKVHGVEKEYSLEEVMSKAQIALASENILDEVKALKRELSERLSVARTDPSGQPAGQPSAQPSPQPQDTSHEAGLPDQDDPVAKLIEVMQFGDAAEARNLFDTTIENRVTARVNSAVSTAVQQAIMNARLADEGARTAKVLADFQEQHKELAADQYANAAIQTRVYELQVEDLRGLGIDPAKIQTESGIVQPADIAMAHRFYRTQGLNIRKPEQMLETAVTDFLKWKGIATPQPAADPAPTPTKAEPQVDLTVERTGRRQAAAQQQPSRAIAPRAVPTPTVQTRDRSDIVREEISRRNKPRNRVIA
jgi:hypothetical protein